MKLGFAGLAGRDMSKKRAGSASRPGTPANAGDDSGSEDEFKPQQQAGGAGNNKGKQAVQQGSKNAAGGGAASGSGGGTADDDMNTLDDAVGYAGVDLNVRIKRRTAGN